MPPHPLINFEIQKVYHNQTKFNGIYSSNNLLKVKNGTYIKNVDKHKPI